LPDGVTRVLSPLTTAFLAVTARTEQFHHQKGAPPAQTSN